MKLLVIIDMQNDFTYGALKNDDAIAVIDKIADKINGFDGEVVFTRDTHEENYLETQEGKKLPVKHCVMRTTGWEIVEKLDEIRKERNCEVIDKPTFGSTELQDIVGDMYENGGLTEVELVGVCTDICVISNAMLIKAVAPEVTVKVDSSCCAGVTKESHETALKAMAACQIEIR